MDGLEQHGDQLLNLTLSLVSHTDDPKIRLDQARKNSSNNNGNNDNNNDSCGHDDHQGEILQLLQLRDQTLNLDKPGSSLLHVLDQEDHDKGLYLIHLLLKTATAIEDSNFGSAMADLTRIYQTISLRGNSAQRVSSYFADGLLAKLLKGKSPFFEMIMKDPSQNEEFLAFTHLYRVSPCYQFSHFTANQAILEKFETEEGRNNNGLHVVDLDLAYGFQWPSLIQSLSEKAKSTRTIFLKITGFARSLEELVETEARLVSFTKGLKNIVFEFQGLLKGSKAKLSLVKRRGNETLAFNLVSCLHSSKDNSVLMILDIVKSMRCLSPSIAVLVQRGGCERRGASFLTSFMDSLRYYAAIFDSLDDCLPRESPERLCIEQSHLGKEIKTSIANWSQDEILSSDQNYERLGWNEILEANGFRGMDLSSRTTMQAKLLLRMRSHCQPQVEGDGGGSGGGFRVFEKENEKAISLGWQDRVLVRVSAWQCL